MTASEDSSPFVTSKTSDALSIAAIVTGRRDSGPVIPSLFRVWGRGLRAFDSILVQPLKTWVRLERDVSLLRGMDHRELRDIGINRMDIDAIRAGTYKRAPSDDAERIVFCPEAGKPVSRTLTEHGPGSPIVRFLTSGRGDSSGRWDFSPFALAVRKFMLH
jgi:uncharacterized protein YjiS (DUF1127 family)